MCSGFPVLIRFGLLFSVLYLAFGVVSPFFPAFLASRGLGPEQIGLILGLSTMIRMIAGPVAGRVADSLQALRIVLAGCTAVAGVMALCFGLAHGFLALLIVSLLHAAMLAPTTLLADALALSAARSGMAARAQFEYGWVRGVGSAAFIIGAVASGQAVNILGPVMALFLQAAFLAAAATAALFVPEVVQRGSQPSRSRGSEIRLLDLARITEFRRVVAVAALVLGSHAMHDSFVMIRWNEIGISSGVGGALWSESVAAEVVVFFAFGPLLLRHIRPEAAMAISAMAAVVRWAAMAEMHSIAAFALIEPLHGLTFALLHLSCMRIIATAVPPTLAATAQAVYGAGIGGMSAVLTLSSGWLYSRIGAHGFWVMAALAALALPIIWSLSRGRQSGV